MRQIQSFFHLFMREPLWFRMGVVISLLSSIVFSSSVFSLGGYSDSVSKLAAMIFFGAFGFNMRRNRRISFLFFAVSAACLYLSLDALP
ncbi:hypothetical protein MKZ15_03380 [Paenibacillus sp. FSL R7-0216]|uniref:hypothetical protein n=1 Tax=Paenibacillus sp. FSL R7-0216 TaxID=2921677 RepID=UPI0030D8C271